VFKKIKKNEPSLEVIIGFESSIKGDLVTKGVVRLDGSINGSVKADWLIVGETGIVNGDVVSRGVVIDGKIEGNITSDEIVEIKSKGAVEGDISTTKLIISEGAFFDGRSCMKETTQAGYGDVLHLEHKAN
jgi:cytoskeletal protein CcmA (bactofilin family)